jgi:hypothetical protein
VLDYCLTTGDHVERRNIDATFQQRLREYVSTRGVANLSETVEVLE